MPFSEADEKFMLLALEEAQKAYDCEEVPVGAVLVNEQGEILARAHNKTEERKEVSAHAELLAIQEASKKCGNWRLSHCTLYVSLEPCPMCAGAIRFSRIRRIVFGASDPRGGAFGSLLNLSRGKVWGPEPLVEASLFEEKSSRLLKDFFQKQRKKKNS